MANRPNVIEDVWKYINKRGPDECWPWTASGNCGYGAFRFGDKQYKAHRVVYFLTYGGISLSAPVSNYEPYHVLHHCDNPGCCNPRHLYLGDINSNMADKVARNRQYRSIGELQANSKLTNADAERIREALLFGAKVKDLAHVYGVKTNVIYGIKEGRTYNVGG